LPLGRCSGPFLGFIPTDLTSTPAEVVERLANRIGVPPKELARYVELVSDRSRREHAQAVIARAGWCTCGPAQRRALSDWLLMRALEHDTQAVLFRQALDHLQAGKIVRPGPDRLMRAVATARAAATREIYRRLEPLLIPELCTRLDALALTDRDLGVAPLVWLGDGATGASPESVKAELVKLTYLRGLGAERLDLSAIAPERLRQLAMIARRSTPRALRQMAPERRYPILLAALAASHTEIVDELVRLVDQALAATDSRARDRLAARQAELVAADVGRLMLLDEMLGVVLDPGRDDAAVGKGLRDLGPERLGKAVRGEDERLPRDGGHLALVEASYSHVRAFAPQVLAALSFAASVTPSDVLDGVQLLQAMNADGRRHVPDGAPTSFVPARWRAYLERARATGEEHLHKHYWELCVLFALQGALRSGEIWVEGSRRYANPASYLIPVGDWPARRTEALELTGMPGTFAERLQAIDADIARYLDDLEVLLADKNGPVRLDEHGELHLSPLAAEIVDPAVLAERDAVIARLPALPLTELLIETDLEAHWSKHLTHAGGAKPRVPELEHRRNLYAAILAQACNYGTSRMAELTGISVDTLDWTTQWYLREETLRPANADMINAHHRHALAAALGGGTLSSSDGLRLPMRGKSLTARALSRYFVDEGVTSYTHVSDQYTTFGTQIIVSTERDATYTLDEILGKHERVGDRRARHRQPRPDAHDIRDVRRRRPAALAADRQAHRETTLAPTRRELLRALAARGAAAQASRPDRCHRRVLGRPPAHRSVPQTRVRLRGVADRQAPSRLAAAPARESDAGVRQAAADRHALRWFTDEAFRRRIGRQLNLGESLNDLRRFIFFAHRGKVRYPRHADQTTQAHCHSLVVNACVLSTTGYLEDAIGAQRADGHAVSDEAISHLSPGHYEPINPYGTLNFDVADVTKRPRRSLRRS
jgi:hypothetical protein